MRRLDTEGRDVTDLPGLWDESDRFTVQRGLQESLAIVPVEMPEETYKQLIPVIDKYLTQNPSQDLHTLFLNAVSYYLLTQETPGSANLRIQHYPTHGRAA